MGRPDTVMQSYLSERPHFADLFNGVFFQGTPVIRPCDLQEASERYSVPGGAGSNRFPLCLYHGVEPWNGPLSLRDMMDFGEDSDGMSALFADYPLRLFCVNSTENFEVFHIELRELLHALKYRNNKSRLLKLLEEDRRYSRLDPDTMEALSVLLDIPAILEQKQTNEEKGANNMCQAIWELRKEEREAGRAEGLEKTKLIIRNMLKRGFSDEDICALAECTMEFIDSVR